ncbi:lysyl endopeptidase precursor [Nonlabens sp. YIK11]|uniref:T9SS type A sorting domain-containing protein n=1 Tax=Nonlabens sp. YIK11 TaxID=1453349 RepID=UPI0006DC05EF|nr:T9SS type A sorting domain-containing protein [Nonlabens sp. YIK11]KQC31944.1 lysyl endopeptidase precursor [Nonlabens sp. YIK11]
MKHTLFLFLFCIAFCTTAQVTNEVAPRSWSMIEKSLTKPEPIILPKVDVLSLQAEDKTSNADGINKALRIGADVPVQLDLYNSGAWTDLPNGDRLWKLNVKSNGAYFMRAIFDLYSIPTGGELYLYNESKTDKIGPYTSNENSESGVLGTWIISGDNFWLEYYEPKAVKGLGRLSIEKITHGYIDVYANEKVGNLNDSFACNVDVLCNPNQGSRTSKNWTAARDNHINSVGRLLISSSRGTGFCSGSLVNNVTEDGTPYFLTANHCLGTGSNKPVNGVGASYSNNFAFGFQWFTDTPDCATFAGTNGPSQPTRVLSGGSVKMNNDNSDMALLLINQMPPAVWDLYYAGWNNSNVSVPTTQMGLHHPSGDIMKLSRNDEISSRTPFNFNDNPSTQVWLINDWEYGVTEGGSSGSMLLNQNEQIIGVLSGGSAACNGTSDNGGFDIYGRVDNNWSNGPNAAQRLRDWLDPNNTGAVSIEGSYFSTLSNTTFESPRMDIRIYPNPSSGIFTIDSDQQVAYQVFNLNGQLIVESAAGISNNTLDLSNAGNGLYFIKLTANGQTVTKKIIKQ